MKVNFLLCITISAVCIFSGCSEDQDVNPGKDEELKPACTKVDIVNPGMIGKIFNYLFFDTEQECIDAQPDPNFFLNCAQQLLIIDDEQATMMLTDIINNVKYIISENKLIVTPASNSEFSYDIIFEIIDKSTLKLIDNATIWKEQKGCSLWD